MILKFSLVVSLVCYKDTDIEALVPASVSQSINQSINTFITRHSTEARATVQIGMLKQREMS